MNIKNKYILNLIFLAIIAIISLTTIIMSWLEG